MVVDVCKSPSSGSLAVYVDGKLARTSSLYRSWSGCGSSVSVSGLPRAAHQVVLVAVANGKRGVVSIDRVRVS